MMYKIGKGRPHWKRRIVVFIIILTLALAGTLSLLLSLKKSTENTTTVQSGTGKTHAYDPDNAIAKLTIDEPNFTFELPGDWKEIKRNDDPRYNSIEWQMGKKPQNRWLKIYMDKYPDDLPVNRLMPVSVEGSRIIEGSPSENCAQFTGIVDKNSPVKIVKAPAKWHNVNFTCNLDNIYLNVMAVGSPEFGPNLKITGANKGNHTYMIIYTDHSIPTDDAPLRTALQSFVAK